MPPFSVAHRCRLGAEEGIMSQSLRLPGDVHHKLFRLFGKHRVGVAAIAGIALLASILWAAPRTVSASTDANCLAWDESASQAVAQLVGDANAGARLADAVFRLKRARNHCRNGFLTLARQDYTALLDGRYGRRQ
jgi:hypothetical protein